MASFTLTEICRATGGRLVQRGTYDHCRGVTSDTRTAGPGQLFIPLRGETYDGHQFLNAAVKKGVAAVVSEPGKYGHVSAAVSVIEVNDTLKALQDLAHFHRMRFSIPVIAVTGSNGKTTTKDMTAAVLSTKFKVRKTEKNHNNEIGLSQTLLALDGTDEACVVEMGMRGFGQIAQLAAVAAPTIGIVTNVSATHIGLLGSLENIAKAKSELISSLSPEDVAILNEDDPYVRKMVSCTGGRVIGYGIEGSHTVQAAQIQYEPDRTRFVCCCFDEIFHVTLHTLGVHNVYNALAAIAAARIAGVPENRMQKGLAEFVPADQRQKITEFKGAHILDDSYNANPLSMEMAFRSLKQMEGKKRIAVLGDMLELGSHENELHYATGKKAAECGMDELVTLGPLSACTARGGRDGGIKKVTECKSCEEIVQYLDTHAQPGDLILIKGSHGMKMENIMEMWERKSEKDGH